MNDSSPEALAKALHAHALKLIRRNGGHLWGTVSSVQGTVPPTLTVTLAGSATPVPGVTYLESYSPAGMDQVLIAALKNGDLCVVGVKASASGVGGGGGGGGGISWPLAYSGEENFQPDGEANNILRLINPDNGENCGVSIGDPGGTGAGAVALYAFSDTATDVDLNIASLGSGGDLSLLGTNRLFLNAANGALEAAGTTYISNEAPELIFFGANTSPTSADIPDGGFALWLDPTPGATVLNIVGKDSGRTVRTASIALT